MKKKNSSRLLIDNLLKHGYEVVENIHDIPYSFKAVYKSEKDGPVIGLMAEYDALPEIGHGCGHDMICSMSLLAAYSLQDIIDEIGGSIIVFGTPGEEGLCYKVKMANEGVFDELDVAMMVHPYPKTYSSGNTMAIESLMVEFYGKSSHAGASPEKGINALDAAVNCYMSVANNKQYLIDTNIYGIFKDGGNQVAIIPNHASLHYYLRTKSAKSLKEARKMVEHAAEGAALAIGCTYKVWNNEISNLNVKTKYNLSDVFNKHLSELGYDIIQDDLKGSTDMGDVSYRVPTIHPWVGMDCKDYALHSKDFADATITEKGDKLLKDGAISLALTGLEVLTDKKLLDAIKKEFELNK